MYKFKVDENLPAEAAELLAGAGHDAATVFDPGSFAPSVDAPGPETTDPESAS